MSPAQNEKPKPSDAKEDSGVNLREVEPAVRPDEQRNPATKTAGERSAPKQDG